MAILPIIGLCLSSYTTHNCMENDLYPLMGEIYRYIRCTDECFIFKDELKTVGPERRKILCTLTNFNNVQSVGCNNASIIEVPLCI